MNTTKIVELVIDEDSQELAIDAISLVSAPAIEENWVFFGKEKNNLTFAKVDEEKRMLISAALIPNKQIFRYDPNTDSEYYVYFSPETVRKASELYLKHNNHHKATHEHSERVSGVLTVESWIKEGDSDKSKLYGFDLPNGTWFVKMKIENEELWKKIKSGELKGLSIEGYFTDKMEKMSETTPTDQEILSALNEIIKNKTELKAEKVELGDVDDLKKLVDKSKQMIKDISGFEKKIQSEQKTLRKAVDNYNSISKNLDSMEKEKSPLYSKMVKLMDNIKKASKELGINANSIDGMQEAIKIQEEMSRRSALGGEASLMFMS